MSWRKKTSQVCLPDKLETSTTFPVPAEPGHQVFLTRYQFFLIKCDREVLEPRDSTPDKELSNSRRLTSNDKFARFVRQD